MQVNHEQATEAVLNESPEIENALPDTWEALPFSKKEAPDIGIAKKAVCILDHPDTVSSPQEALFVVEIQGNLYIIPFERTGAQITLKTIYSSKKLTQLYQKKLLAESC